MVVLTYDTAKRSLIMMSLYLICASLIFKGVGCLFEYNFMAAFQSFSGGIDLNFKFPKFNINSLSFDWIANSIGGKIKEVLQVLIPSALGNIDHISTAMSSIPAPKDIVADTTRATLKV